MYMANWRLVSIQFALNYLFWNDKEGDYISVKALKYNNFIVI